MDENANVVLNKIQPYKKLFMGRLDDKSGCIVALSHKNPIAVIRSRNLVNWPGVATAKALS